MKYLLFYCFLIWTQCLLSAQSQTRNLIFSPQSVAKSFNYRGELNLVDNSESVRDQVSGKLFWSRIFTSNDGSFVPAVITLASGGSVLTNQLQSKLELAIAKMPKAETVGTPRPCERVQLSDGSKGYAFVTGVGAGGSGCCAIVTSSDHRYDLVLTLNFPGNGEPIKQTELTRPCPKRRLARG